MAGGAYAILTTWDNAGADLAIVPPVVGLNEAEAKTKIQAAGFEFQKQGEQQSAEVVKGDVVRQDPKEGAKLAEGKTVSVWISSGGVQMEVPTTLACADHSGPDHSEGARRRRVGADLCRGQGHAGRLRSPRHRHVPGDRRLQTGFGHRAESGRRGRGASEQRRGARNLEEGEAQQYGSYETISDYDGDLVLSGDWTITGRVNGNVKISEGTLTVTGWVDGSIDQYGRGSVVILRGAHVNGNIYEKDDGDVVVSGYVEGNVEESGDGSVEITAGGEVEGNVFERDKGTVKNAGYVSGNIDY